MLDIAMTLSIAACAQPVVGGWNEARGGAFSLVDGEETDGLRQDILDMGFELVGTETLTPEFLGGVDTFVLIVITTGNTAITALTGPEQEAMLDFVDAGGVLLAFLDNDTFAGQLGDDAITSILDPFGLSADGTIIGGPHLVTIADPTSTPVTDGPCGIIESFPTFFPGWFDAVGDSTPLGTLRNGQVGAHVVRTGRGRRGGGRLRLGLVAARRPVLRKRGHQATRLQLATSRWMRRGHQR